VLRTLLSTLYIMRLLASIHRSAMQNLRLAERAVKILTQQHQRKPFFSYCLLKTCQNFCSSSQSVTLSLTGLCQTSMIHVERSTNCHALLCNNLKLFSNNKTFCRCLCESTSTGDPRKDLRSSAEQSGISEQALTTLALQILDRTRQCDVRAASVQSQTVISLVRIR
ncbi:hypothetical protein ElyMa_001488300, partial [Elysia marginata]